MNKEELLVGINNNFIQRQRLLMGANTPKMQADIMTECKGDILFFFEYFLFTVRDQNMFDEVLGDNIPFILFDFQKEFVLGVWACIQEASLPSAQRVNYTDVFIEKSRQMGVSWMLVGVFLYGFIFHNHRYLLLSSKEDLVDKGGDMKSLFEKLRYMISLLPDFMLPPGLTKQISTGTNKRMSLSRTDGSGSITGESANPNASRGGTFNAIFFDEMASMENAGMVNTAASRATACRIYNSTPAGKGNEFYRVRERGAKAINKGQICPFQWFRLHWSEHPFYDDIWYERQCANNSPEAIAAELDISYNNSVKGRVYPEYDGNIVEVEYDERFPLFVAIDNSHGGADPHAIIIAQKDGDLINIIDYLEINCSVTDMANILAKKPQMALNDTALEFYNRYIKYKKGTFVADPYDTNSKLNTSTIAQEYAKVDIYLNVPSQRDKRNQIITTQNNMHRIRINESARDLANCIMNSRYKMKDDGESTSSENSLPLHDQFSHGRSAFEYLINFITETDLSKNNRHNFTKGKVLLNGAMDNNWFMGGDASEPFTTNNLTTGYYGSIL